MITGFITTPEVAAQITAAITQAFVTRNLPQFWTLQGMPLYSGENVGLIFIPASDQILSTPLMGTPPQTPQDFPEFAVLLELLGGLEARQEIDPLELVYPDAVLPEETD